MKNGTQVAFKVISVHWTLALLLTRLTLYWVLGSFFGIESQGTWSRLKARSACWGTEFVHHSTIFLFALAHVVYLLQSCLTLCDTMDCSPPGSSVHGIFQARRLEWVAISFSRGSFGPRDGTCVSCLAGRFFTTELPGKEFLQEGKNTVKIFKRSIFQVLFFFAIV